MTRRPARSRRAHRILVTALALSPLVVLVILVLAMLRTVEERAQRASGIPGAQSGAQSGAAPEGATSPGSGP